MPRETYDSFQSKLDDMAEKMAKERWLPLEDGVELVQRPLSYYKEQYLQEYLASGPDRRNLQQALKDFRQKNKADYPDFIPKLSGASEEELQQRMQHADACMKAMADVAFAEVEHSVCMYDTINRLFGQKGTAKALLGPDWSLSGILEQDKLDVTCQLTGMRGLQDLMDTGNGPKAQEHNERAIMLMALNERKISEADYRTLRESQLKDRYPQDYQNMVEKELSNSFGELFEMVRESVESRRVKRYSPDMDQHIACISDMNETDPEKIGKAVTAVFGYGSQIAFSGTNIMHAMQAIYKNPDGTKLQLNPYQQQLLKAWEDEECDYRRLQQSPLSAMANPYAAILDQQELTDFMLMTPMAANHPDQHPLDAWSDFCLGVATFSIGTREKAPYISSKEAQTREILEQAGMQDAVKTDTMHPEMQVYEKDGQKLIVRTEHDLRGDPHVRSDVPGQLINYDLRARLSELDELCSDRDQGHGSKAYTNMRNALHALKDTTLSDNPTSAELNALQKNLTNLKEKVDAYMARKRKQRTAKGDMEVIGGKPYERLRISFARELDAFTQDKLAAIQTIRDHQATMQRGMDVINVGPQAPEAHAPAMREPEGNQLQKVLTNINELTLQQAQEKAEKAPHEKTGKKLERSNTVKESHKKPPVMTTGDRFSLKPKHG